MSSSLEELKQSHDVDVRWYAFELRPPEAPPISEEYRAQILAKRPQFVEMARERFGLEINEGPFGIDSRPALIGAKYAETQGLGEAYNWAVLQAYWTEAKSIDQRDVLADIAENVGLDRAAYLAALDDPQYFEAEQADIKQAHAYGLNAVPSLILAEKYLISGAQPYAVLAQAVEQIQAELDGDERV